MIFYHMGKKYLLNSRSNLKGYRVEFLKKILATATDEKIIEKINAEIAAREAK